MMKEILNSGELKQSVEVVRESFSTVAREFGLTRQNCPTNPAFATLESLENLKEKGAEFFALYEHDKQIGFVAIEKADEVTYYMEKLAVMPEYRRKGYGKSIVSFVFDHVREKRGEKVSIGIMDNNHALKNWYGNLGFVETSARKFKHLPFIVCFMEKGIGVADSESCEQPSSGINPAVP
jgi:ribosomal protein S18 acetylase RimI-like enzyme